MTGKAKIHLSALETELVNNTEWIFTKQLIIEKVYHLFGDLHDEYKSIIAESKGALPKALLRPGSKITKGENYKRLPYIILDYPALFGKENIFAIRTMFWWGNFFSISLHLSGDSLTLSKDFFLALKFLSQKNFFICINEKEWEHDFHSSNYIKIGDLDETQIAAIKKKEFIKVATKIELSKWDKVPQFLKQSFTDIIEFIKISFPDGEKVL